MRHVAKICENYGIRVQNSVFECIIDQSQYLVIRDKLKKEIDEKQDSIRFYRLGNHYTEKAEHYGISPVNQVDKPLIL